MQLFRLGLTTTCPVPGLTTDKNTVVDERVKLYKIGLCEVISLWPVIVVVNSELCKLSRSCPGMQGH